MVSRKETNPERNAKATLTWGIPEPAAAGAQNVSPRPTTSPPTAGESIVQKIQVLPCAKFARLIIKFSSQAIARWNATAESPHKPPARMVTARRRWRSLAILAVNHARKREKILRSQFA